LLGLCSQSGGIARAGLHHNAEFCHASSMWFLWRFYVHLNRFPAERQWFEPC
jgi:hypothetical protein